MTSKRWMTSLMAVLVATVAACSGGAASSAPASQTANSAAPSAANSAGSSAAAGTPVTIEWWHITTADPGKSDFQSIADAYTAAHPNVKINITILENEAFKTKLQATAQSGDIPDLFQSWGGGTMREQADAGLLKDITADIASWKDTINPGALGIYAYNGKQYAVPWDLGIFGVWYNTEQFKTAGITTPPATWDDYLSAVDKLKAAKIAPISMGLKDKWPAMHLWALVLLRIAGGDAMTQMVQGGDWNTDACKAAGAEIQKLVAKKPFQEGYLNATHDVQQATLGNGQAAMEVQGHWGANAQAANSSSGKGLGDKLGWFPFPTVAGGKGLPTDAVGGANGIAVGKNAPPEAIDFLKFFSSPENASKIGKGGGALPTTLGSEASITDSFLKQVVEARSKATFVQLYLDQATSPALGAAINDATAALVAGTSTPEQTCQAITDAAKSQ